MPLFPKILTPGPLDTKRSFAQPEPIAQFRDVNIPEENILHSHLVKTSTLTNLQGGSNTTGTNCDLFTHK